MQCRNRLGVDQRAVGHHTHDLIDGSDLDLDLLMSFQMLPTWSQPGRLEHMHAFIGEPGRGVEGAQWIHTLRLVSRLLGQLTGGGHQRRLTGLQRSGWKLPQHVLHGHPPVSNQDQMGLVEHRNDQDRPGMTDDAPIDGRTV